MDGPLGAYMRKLFTPQGLFAFPKMYDYAMRQIFSVTKPLRNREDMSGYKVITPLSNLTVDFYRSLGMSPIALSGNEWYTALQTHLADGGDSPLQLIEDFKWFEVARYISITNHQCSTPWMVANLDAWNSLPADIQNIVMRNHVKYTDLERRDVLLSERSVGDLLRRQGISFNTVDSQAWRSTLTAFYGRWKNEFGSTIWGLLESGVGGKLG
jgi:TRAP-type C4-dicarboxylate transport system substrate-binding protein